MGAGQVYTGCPEQLGKEWGSLLDSPCWLEELTA